MTTPGFFLTISGRQAIGEATIAWQHESDRPEKQLAELAVFEAVCREFVAQRRRALLPALAEVQGTLTMRTVK